MKRKVLFAILIVSLLFAAVFTATSFAASETTEEGETSVDSPVFYDEADFLSAAEKARVLLTLNEAQEKTGYHYGVLLYRSRYDGGARHNRMKEEDSILLLIWEEFGEYRYELFTYGEPNREITDREADSLLDADEVYDNIKGGHLADGICAFASLSAEAAIPDPNAAAKRTGRTVVISLLLALACAGGAAFAVVYPYKKKLKAPIYPLDRFARMKLVDKGDAFITSHVTRVRVSSPSNSSGGGRSSGGGNGGSRGSR